MKSRSLRWTCLWAIGLLILSGYWVCSSHPPYKQDLSRVKTESPQPKVPSSPSKSADDQSELFVFYQELSAAAQSEAEFSNRIEANPTMISPTVNRLLKEAIELELVGKSAEALQVINDAKKIADLAYKLRGNKNAFQIVANFFRWTPQQKQSVHTAKKLTMEGEDLLENAALEEALMRFQQAYTLYETNDDNMGVIFSLFRLGKVHLRFYEYTKAIGCFQKAYDLSAQMQEYQPMIKALLNLGYYEYLAGDYAHALATTRRAVELTQKYQDKRYLATTLVATGTLYKAIGHYDEAIRLFNQALDAHPNRWLKIEINTALAEAEFSSNRYDTANRILDEVLLTADRKKDQRAVAHALVLRGQCYRRLHNYDGAIARFKEALDFATGIRDNYAQMDALLGMAECYTLKGENKKAWDCYARMPSDKLWYPYAKIPVLQGKGLIYEREHSYEQAREYYQAAIDEFEKGRANLSASILKLNYFESFGSPYDYMIDLLSLRGEYEEAFYYKERATARNLLDSVTKPHSLFKAPEGLARRKKEVQAELSFLQKTLVDEYGKAGPTGKNRSILELEKKLVRARETYLELLEKIDILSNKTIPFSIQPKHYVSNLQKTILQSDRALIAYHVEDKATLAWVVTDRGVGFKRLPIGRADLLKHITDLREPIETYKRKRTLLKRLDYPVDVAHGLYRSLFQPLEDYLAGRQRIIVVPDDVLHYIPFDSLVINPLYNPPNSDRWLYSEYRRPLYLIDRYVISYAASANVLQHLCKRHKPVNPKATSLLAMGDPVTKGLPEGQENNLVLRSALNWIFNPVPRTEQEVKDVASRFKHGRIFVKNEATEDIFKRLAPDYDIIHLATHGISDDKQPLYSLILLSPSDDPSSKNDGLVQGFEIYDLKLKADLIVLSACDTGYGKLSKGEGVLGLAHSFFQAGAKTAVVSLWSVGDDSTALLMKDFYDNLLASGMEKADALRAAKLKLLRAAQDDLKHKSYAHPLLWAPFILSGDPR